MNEHDQADISAYLKQISAVPLLKRPEEIALGHAIQGERKRIVDTLVDFALGRHLIFLGVTDPALLGFEVEEAEDDEAVEKEEKPSVAGEEDREGLRVAALAMSRNNDTLFKKVVAEFLYGVDKNAWNDEVAAATTIHDIKISQGRIEVARRKLVQHNLRLVVSIAKSYTGTGAEFMDLIEEGSVGLIRAADKFDADRGTKFVTVATWWVRQAIIRSLSNKLRTIRIPVHMVDAMHRAIKVLTAKLRRLPDPAELLVELKMPHMTELQVREVLGIMSPLLSVDEMMSEDENDGERNASFKFGEFSEAAVAETDLVDNDLRRKLLARIREHLEPREEKILRLKVGM